MFWTLLLKFAQYFSKQTHLGLFLNSIWNLTEIKQITLFLPENTRSLRCSDVLRGLREQISSIKFTDIPVKCLNLTKIEKHFATSHQFSENIVKDSTRSSKHFLRYWLIHFMSLDSFYTLLKHHASGGIEKDQWHEMG